MLWEPDVGRERRWTEGQEGVVSQARRGGEFEQNLEEWLGRH